MKCLMVLAVLPLAACAPKPIAGNEAGGVIHIAGMLDGQAKGMKAADAECRKYGKIARYRSTNDLRATLSYDCVAS